MSIWGDADVAELSDDPFKIEEGWYEATCVDMETIKNPKATYHRTIVFKWKLTGETAYKGLPVKDRNTVYALKKDDLEPEQLQRNSFTLKRIIEAFDKTKEQAQDFDKQDALGVKAWIYIVNKPDKENDSISYNNIQQALSERLYRERMEEAQATSDVDSDALMDSLLRNNDSEMDV